MLKNKSQTKTPDQLDIMMDDVNLQIKKYTTSPEELAELARFMSKIHNYSIANKILINKQFPNARVVASFANWKKQGFFVQKGEKGIQILAPVLVTTFKNDVGFWKKISEATVSEKAKLASNKFETKKATYFKKRHRL